MFKALTPAAQSTEATGDTPEPIVTPEPVVLAFDHDAFEDDLAAIESLNDSIVNLDQMSSDIETLFNLKESIESHGLSRGTVAFADSGKYLSTAIRTFPALETLQGDLTVEDETTKKALEGITDTIKATMAAWAKHAWEMVLKGMEVTAKVTEGWLAKLGHLASAAKDKVFSAEKAENAKAGEGTPSMAMLQKIMKAIAEIPAKLKSMWTKPADAAAATEGLTEEQIAEAKTAAEAAAAEAQAAFEALSEEDKAAHLAAKQSEEATAAFEFFSSEAALEAMDGDDMHEESHAGKTLSALGYTKEAVENLWKFIGDFVKGTVPAFFKSLAERVRSVLSSAATFDGEKARAARGHLADRLKSTWKLIRDGFLKAVRSLYKGASAASHTVETPTAA